jgi:hypothetical protein
MTKLDPPVQGFLGKLERLTSTETNFGFSFTRLFLLKIRVITEYLIRLFLNQKLFQFRELKKLESSIEALVIVLANGPSLNNLNPEQYLDLQLKGFKFFALNSYALSELGKIVKPNYYVLSDPQHKRRIQEASDPLTLALNSYGESLVVFVPNTWKHTSNINCKVVAFNDFSLYGISNNIKVWKPRGYTSLTAYKALAIALHISSKPVGIIGFDNSEFHFLRSDEHNRTLLIPGKLRHFFTQESESVDLSNLFPEGLGDALYAASLAFKSLEIFPKERIVNLDLNSLTDAFPKKTLEGFFEYISLKKFKK